MPRSPSRGETRDRALRRDRRDNRKHSVDNRVTPNTTTSEAQKMSGRYQARMPTPIASTPRSTVAHQCCDSAFSTVRSSRHARSARNRTLFES